MFAAMSFGKRATNRGWANRNGRFAVQRRLRADQVEHAFDPGDHLVAGRLLAVHAVGQEGPGVGAGLHDELEEEGVFGWEMTVEGVRGETRDDQDLTDGRINSALLGHDIPCSSDQTVELGLVLASSRLEGSLNAAFTSGTPPKVECRRHAWVTSKGSLPI